MNAYERRKKQFFDNFFVGFIFLSGLFIGLAHSENTLLYAVLGIISLVIATIFGFKSYEIEQRYPK